MKPVEVSSFEAAAIVLMLLGYRVSTLKQNGFKPLHFTRHSTKQAEMLRQLKRLSWSTDATVASGSSSLGSKTSSL